MLVFSLHSSVQESVSSRAAPFRMRGHLDITEPELHHYISDYQTESRDLGDSSMILTDILNSEFSKLILNPHPESESHFVNPQPQPSAAGKRSFRFLLKVQSSPLDAATKRKLLKTNVTIRLKDFCNGASAALRKFGGEHNLTAGTNAKNFESQAKETNEANNEEKPITSLNSNEEKQLELSEISLGEETNPNQADDDLMVNRLNQLQSLISTITHNGILAPPSTPNQEGVDNKHNLQALSESRRITPESLTLTLTKKLSDSSQIQMQEDLRNKSTKIDVYEIKIVVGYLFQIINVWLGLINEILETHICTQSQRPLEKNSLKSYQSSRRFSNPSSSDERMTELVKGQVRHSLAQNELSTNLRDDINVLDDIKNSLKEFKTELNEMKYILHQQQNQVQCMAQSSLE